MSDKPDDLALTKKLFEFLQGNIPEGFSITRKRRPKLTADQAWTVIWYLGNEYWRVTDHIQRCNVCGDLYDGWREGRCLDYGGPPYFFCDACMDSGDYVRKMRRHPDKRDRDEYFRD